MTPPRLHETLRRRICRTGFCLFCLLPTAGVLGYSASRKLPSHARRCETELSGLLGLRATLASVRYPRPGVTLYEELELADPETGERALRFPWLESESIEGRMVLSATQPAIETDGLGLVWERLMRRLRREPVAGGMLRLTPCQVTLRGPRGSQTYEDVQALIEPAEQGEAIELRFRLAGGDESEAASFRVVRDRSQATPFTRFELDTCGGELPVSIFTGLADVEGWLGSASRFSGSLWVEEGADGCEAEVTGRLLAVDLQTLVGDRFPHQLAGEAEIEIAKALVHHGRLTEAAGSFTAGPGTIGASLLEAAVETLEFEPGRFQAPTSSAVAFQELAFHFRVDAGGLRLSGRCRGVPRRGVVLAGSDGRVLLGSSGEGSLPPVINLVRMLVPQSEVQVPATRETTELLQVLPIPPIVGPGGEGDERPPQGRLRLSPVSD